MTSVTERVSQRRATESMLRAGGSRISFRRTPTTQTKNERGGTTKGPPQELDPQLVKVIHNSPWPYRNTPGTPSAGVISQSRDQLLLRWDADVQKGDKFDFEDIEYEVTWVWAFREYETRAELHSTEQPHAS